MGGNEFFKTNSTENYNIIIGQNVSTMSVEVERNQESNLKIKNLKQSIEPFYEKEDYYKPARVCIFLVTIISNIKVMAMEIKYYQSNNSLIKLNHT